LNRREVLLLLLLLLLLLWWWRGRRHVGRDREAWGGDGSRRIGRERGAAWGKMDEVVFDELGDLAPHESEVCFILYLVG
jgi:hypothetical protein